MNFDAELWILKSIAKHKKYTFLTIIGSLVDITLFTLPAFFIAKVITFLSNAQYNVAFQNIVLYFLVGVTQVLFFGTADYYNEVLAHRITTDMTLELNEALQSRSLTYHIPPHF